MHMFHQSVLPRLILGLLAASATGCGGASLELPPDAGAADSANDMGHPAANATTRATITFQVKNTGTGSVYLFEECVFPIQVTAVAGGKIYGNGVGCACDCASTSCTGGVMCGACLEPTGYELVAGAVLEIPWSAQWSVTQTKTGVNGAFQCVSLSPIPTGEYQMAIVVYASAPDAAAKVNGRIVRKAFTLGTADAEVVVPVE